MENTSVSPAQSSRVKTVSLIALAIVGTMVASYAMLNVSQTQLVQVSSDTSGNNTNCIDAWNAWKAKHNKTFTVAENDKRFQIFCNAHNKINNNNNDPSSNIQLAHNQFSHLTQEEWAATSHGLKQPKSDPNAKPQESSRLLAALPSSVNWVTAGAVTPIKNQGQCGSCYTFSSTGALEGLNYIKNKKLVSLSEQELVDCSSVGKYGNGGCNGGWMGTCFQFVIDNKGISGENVYTAYSATEGTCKSTTAKAYTGPAGYTQVTANSQSALMTAIAQQPVSVCIEADQSAFQYYKSGVLTSANCGTNTDHAVLAVGYAPASGSTPAYYLVKNSWGTGWGESGFFRLANTGNGAGTCGVQTWAIYPHA